MSEIKPCPFCGGRGQLITFKGENDNTLGYFIECENLLDHCKVAPSTDICKTKEEVIKIWNGRRLYEHD